MFGSFIRPPCQCASKNYELYHTTFMSILSHLSTNKTKNETLASHLCEYFDIKKKEDFNIEQLLTFLKSDKLSADDYRRIINSCLGKDTSSIPTPTPVEREFSVYKGGCLNKCEPAASTSTFISTECDMDYFRKACDKTIHICKEKGIDMQGLESMLDMAKDLSKEFEKDVQPEHFGKLMTNIMKPILAPYKDQVNEEQLSDLFTSVAKTFLTPEQKSD